jgi:hypothetical protein
MRHLISRMSLGLVAGALCFGALASSLVPGMGSFNVIGIALAQTGSPGPDSSGSMAENPPQNLKDTENLITGPYTSLPVDHGVFNDGKAALWDLNILDHYKYFGPRSRGRGYKPEQPIAFSHITHVQKNQMDCQYCHWSVSKAAFAAIPETETCMGCHNLVKGRSDFQKSEIAKLEQFYKDGTPIPWIKVHVMPAHVHFNHKRHIKAGVNCQECHGQVPNMSTVERVTSMKMGWCIDCHRQQGTSIDCWTCHK